MAEDCDDEGPLKVRSGQASGGDHVVTSPDREGVTTGSPPREVRSGQRPPEVPSGQTTAPRPSGQSGPAPCTQVDSAPDVERDASPEASDDRSPEADELGPLVVELALDLARLRALVGAHGDELAVLRAGRAGPDRTGAPELVERVARLGRTVGVLDGNVGAMLGQSAEVLDVLRGLGVRVAALEAATVRLAERLDGLGGSVATIAEAAALRLERLEAFALAVAREEAAILRFPPLSGPAGPN